MSKEERKDTPYIDTLLQSWPVFCLISRLCSRCMLFFKTGASSARREHKVDKVAHLHVVQPLLQRLQHPLHLLRGRGDVPLCHVFVLPMAVAAVASGSVPPHGWVVGCVWYEVGVSMVTLLVAIVPLVGVYVMGLRPCVISVS